jgi:hypothetical protein
MHGHEDDQNWYENSRPATQEEMEWVRLWVAFLNLSDRNQWIDEVKHYFGEATGDFEIWWAEHSDLFRMEKEPQVAEVTTDEEYQAWKVDALDKKDLESSGVIIVAVPLYATKETLRTSFEELLKKYHVGRAGRPDLVSDQGNVFNFYDKPDTVMLSKILAVYQVYMDEQGKPKENRMKLWQIEEAVSKTTPLLDKKGYLWKVDEMITNNEVIKTSEQRKRSQNTVVRKYINYAEEILANVVLGCFPVYDGSKPSAKYQTKIARETAALIEQGYSI